MWGVEKESWPKIQALCTKQWNSLALTKIPSIEMFIWSLQEQMVTKGRVRNGILQMRFLFGRAKAGQEFQMERDRHNYVCKDFEDGVKFSQSGNSVSPYIQKVGNVK